jgi:hypothetical protein
MSNKTIKIGQLDMELQSIFSAFEHHVHTAVDTAAEKTAEEAVKKLKKTSPKNKRAKRGKKYKNGWKYKKISEGMTVYNEQYQLTHLLENGHDIIINGEVRGHADAHVHIAPVEAWAQDEFPEEFKRQVEKG